MKAHLWRHFRQPARVGWTDLLLLALAIGGWIGAYSARSIVITPRCATNPVSCARDTLNPIDRATVDFESSRSDQLSFTTQSAAGYLGFALPPLWSAILAGLGRITPGVALAAAGTDILLFFQTAALNGAFNETTRVLAQRPRPFVYANPGMHGGSLGNYTSFYSGHTSFAAASTFFALVALAGRAAPPLLLFGTGSAAIVLTLLTGTFRVLSGRHFPTDVVFGACAGISVALLVSYFHRRRSLRF